MKIFLRLIPTLALLGCMSLAEQPLDRTELDEAVRILQARADPGYPVRVLVREEEGMVGSATWHPVQQAYVITIDPTVVEEGGSYLVHILAHEWAHLMIWDSIPSHEPHDALWGVSFARAYRMLMHD